MNQSAAVAAAELFCTIQIDDRSIPIYHVYKHGLCRGPQMIYHYSTADYGQAHYDCIFDIRDYGLNERTLLDLQNNLGIEPGLDEFLGKVKQAIEEAIEQDRIPYPL